MAGFNRQANNLFLNGYKTLANLRGLLKERFGKDDIVSATDVKDVMLNILELIEDIEDAIPAPTPASADYKYIAGTGGAGLVCTVTATSGNVVYAVSGGVGTITIPADTILKGFTVDGATSILNEGSFTVRIVWGDTSINPTANTAYLCVWQIVNASAQDVGIPSSGLPNIVDNDNTPQKQFTAIGSNMVELTVPGLNAFTRWYFVAVMA